MQRSRISRSGSTDFSGQRLLEFGPADRVLNSRCRQKNRCEHAIEWGGHVGQIPRDESRFHQWLCHRLLRYVREGIAVDADRPAIQLLAGPRTAKIRVLGVMDYCIAWAERRVTVSSVRHAMAKPLPPFVQRSEWDPAEVVESVDLLRPLSGGHWLFYVVSSAAFIERLQAEWPLHDLWRGQRVDDEPLIAVFDRVARRLRNDAQFVALRHAISQAIIRCVGVEVFHLALRSRPIPEASTLESRHLSRVWLHREVYARMGRENPRLLPVLSLWMQHRSSVRAQQPFANDDALPPMRHAFLSLGLSPRAWRRLAHHGPRPFHACARRAITWDRLCESIRLMETVGWPAIPPRGFLSFLIDVAGYPRNDDGEDFGIAGWFWHWACDAASQCRGSASDYQRLRTRLTRWAVWVLQRNPQPDRHQQRLRFRWLARWADAVELEQEQALVPEWGPWLKGVSLLKHPRVQVCALLNARDLLSEAAALHNCAHGYLQRCIDGQVILLSLRDQLTGRRLALMAVKRVFDPPAWTLHAVAGPCNQTASPWLWAVAGQVAQQVNALAAMTPKLLQIANDLPEYRKRSLNTLLPG